MTIQNRTDPLLKKLQQVWIDEDVVQCGYCQPGIIMQVAASGPTISCRDEPNSA